MSITIYHNPRCSKSRATLEIIREAGFEPEIIEYLNHPPDAPTLQKLLSLLGMAAIDLVRTGESAWSESGLEKTADSKTLIKAMIETPILMQRPIVVAGDRAVIGRPPECVRPLLEHESGPAE